MTCSTYYKKNFRLGVVNLGGTEYKQEKKRAVRVITVKEGALRRGIQANGVVRSSQSSVWRCHLIHWANQDSDIKRRLTMPLQGSCLTMLILNRR